jgi:hypothetical protein
MGLELVEIVMRWRRRLASSSRTRPLPSYKRLVNSTTTSLSVVAKRSSRDARQAMFSVMFAEC